MGIREYWVIDVRARRIEVRRRPTDDDGYALLERITAEGELAIAALEGVTLSARNIFERLDG